MKSTAIALITALALPYISSADSVSVAPVNPTTVDPLHFSLYNQSRCCATTYYNARVFTNNDTMIVLAYAYDDSLCPYVDCLVGGSWHTFDTGPVAAGTYAIYEEASEYCPPDGRMCALVPGPIVMMRVGQVTVTEPSRVEEPTPAHSVSKEPFVKYDPGTGDLVVRLDYPQMLSVRVVSLGGTMLAESVVRAGAGESHLRISTGAGHGAVVADIRGQGIKARLLIAGGGEGR